MNKKIEIESLKDHPLNREFPRSGEKWEGLVASMKMHGQLSPVVVRPLVQTGGGGYQVLAGHRRKAAAEAVGIRELDCVSRRMTDKEALEFVVLENLEREEVDTCEEARLVVALVESRDGDAAAVAKRLSRSLEWVATRQGLLELGEEVLDAVRRPRTDEGHLHLNAVEVLLAVPAEDRERAVQLVLHPDFQMGALNARQAADVVKETILEPRRKRLEWEAAGRKFAKAWRGRLKKVLNKAEAKDLAVLPVQWEQVEKCARVVTSGRDAEEFLNGEVGYTWAQLAVRNGLTVWVIPADNEEGSRAVVEEWLLRQAEEARAAAGIDSWLMPVAAAAEPVVKTGLRETGVEAVADVLADQEKEESNEPEEPEAEVVIEQRMEHFAMIDLGQVRRLKMWAGDVVSGKVAGDAAVPEWAPDWVSDSGIYFEDVGRICEWVMGLKQGAGKAPPVVAQPKPGSRTGNPKKNPVEGGNAGSLQHGTPERSEA